MGVMFQCENLSKNYNGHAALSNVNLSLESGRIVGLLGPNGSGKTTLAKISNGLITPSSGSILLNQLPPGVKTKSFVSYLPDVTYLPDWMKIESLIEMYQDFYTDFSTEKAYKMINNLSLSKKSIFKTLSKGNKEKVQLILAMSRNASIYILDEPIGGVDPSTRDYILSTIIGNYNPDALVIISTHLISEVETILDEVVFIKQGELLFHRTVDEIRDTEKKSVDQLFREVFKC